VAIVGSGPSGFYAAAALLKADAEVRVTMFERFPTPFGLVRFGVAPDHAKIRNVIKAYSVTAAHEHFRYFGNVEIGRDLTVAELREAYDAVVLAFGAASDRKLGIPGEDLPGSYSATEFCSWYNGHPDFVDLDFDLHHETAVVIGQGNVAMDVARVLAKPVDELHTTDMTAHAVQTLRESKVKTIYVVGRRGPAQAKFTPKEIKELGEITDCDLIIDPEDLELDDLSQKELELPGHESNQRNMEILHELAAEPTTGAERRIRVVFFESPVELIGEERVEAVKLEKNRLLGEPGASKARGTGETRTLPCGLVFRSVGYKGVAIPGIPFDERAGVVPNEAGRAEPGLYVTGWIKRGPSGLIGTNKKDSEETVDQVLADVSAMDPTPRPGDERVAELLADRGVRAVSYEDWLKLDQAEIERGKAAGKPREKFTRIEEMIAYLDEQAEVDTPSS